MQNATDINCGNGHLFCNKCLLQFYKHKAEDSTLYWWRPSSSSITHCPLCQQTTQHSNTIRNHFVDRLISKLQVQCPTSSETFSNNNSSAVCHWTGDYCAMKDHLFDGCMFWTAQCIYCKKNIVHKNMRNHKINCDERPSEVCTNDGCYEIFSKSGIVRHEVHECRYRKVVCGNRGCGERFVVGHESNMHKFGCSEGIVRCGYHDRGCRHRMKRRLLDKHYRSKHSGPPVQ